MEDAISHEKTLRFTRRTITASDLTKWPGAAIDGAGHLREGRVFTGSSRTEAQPLKLKRITFSDPRSSPHYCKFFALSEDGKLLAASFNSNDVLVWRLSDGLLVQRLHCQGHTGWVAVLSFSPIDSYTLASGSLDGSAIVWDTRSGRVLLRLEEHGGPVHSIAYAPHGALIATGTRDDGCVKVWDASSGACLHFFGNDNSMYKLAFTPDSSFLCAELAGSCIIYDTHTYTRTATLQHVAGKWHHSLISHQGDRIITVPHSDHPGQVKIWSAATGKELLAIEHSTKLSMPVAFSPDGAEVVATCGTGSDAAAVTYNSRTGQLCRIFKFETPVDRVAYSPDGEYVVFSTRNGTDVELYNAKSGAFLAMFDGREEGWIISDIRFSPDSQILLARSGYGPLHLYNVQDVLRMR
ncbi:uncharacterized protein PHACADRAFT_253777 [Phanerochaete carnosa HHB-10118-sp]|uniref:Uncharacterized protein n=1 Tax=Phanerochaete carnosa (strain HHB-10118-sp) TaxID=650164 RepID=K5WBH5_PHACS|nr:uncharacterized protein PHACADRAFT_253777 [Phanerochaete carnosa HHB-10118-sp]EKM56570.1 hypothetical protein PHACADRAFT_253777 [Phanerochaete carnosa HHB-10118-sp]